MKTFKNMTDSEFSICIKTALNRELSPFAKFCQNSAGFDYVDQSGKQLDRWEVFDMGHTKANQIIKGNTAIIAVRKPVEQLN